ncbi:MAG TPA: HAD hydrolase-like protein [Bacteriovoracaceae bacterium]|nr:HAD hydrolase-like protein [Bacteriovoracaceae bacterium]
MKYIIFDCDGTLIDSLSRNYPLFPGVRELIVELAQENKLYVWTARDRTSTLRILTENGINQYFEALCTVSDAAPKPSVAGLLMLVGSVPKDSICVIGDSSNDMLGGKCFGVLSIGAVWNREANATFLKDAGADFIVSHPSECSKLVELKLKGDKHV